jgi:KaiC/GvpD/RAD55 family RecA-like ATPase
MICVSYLIQVSVMERIASGIKGLDELLGGGLPKGRCILLVGAPGSGKTTFAMQFLVGGVSQGERGLYVALDERPESVKENMADFGWNLEGLEAEGGLVFLDATLLRKAKKAEAEAYAHEIAIGILPSAPQLTMTSLIRTVRKIAEEENIQRIAVDPITSLMLRFPQQARRRYAILRFFDALMSTGATCMVTTELRTAALNRAFQVEEFLSQGVILLHTMVHEGSVLRAIQVEKMRGIAHDTQLRPYQIGAGGIEVFPSDRVFR